jgi:trehalose 6-phosphate synthase
MNLVAKEYVAAQNPIDPGVLVLSKFAGAAKELDTALQVNPHDIDGMARTLATALSMPAPERRMRWEAMMEKLRAGNIQHWFASFVDELEKTHVPEKPQSRFGWSSISGRKPSELIFRQFRPASSALN